jgi:hypothetical protein
VTTGEGDDVVLGGAGDDLLDAGAGDDLVSGDGGQATLVNDVPTVFETLDFFEGGDDEIIGGAGEDVMFGGSGGDLFHGDLSEDVIIGQNARLTLDEGDPDFLVTLAPNELDLLAGVQFTLYDSNDSDEDPGTQGFLVRLLDGSMARFLADNERIGTEVGELASSSGLMVELEGQHGNSRLSASGQADGEGGGDGEEDPQTGSGSGTTTPPPEGEDGEGVPEGEDEGDPAATGDDGQDPDDGGTAALWGAEDGPEFGGTLLVGALGWQIAGRSSSARPSRRIHWD